MINERITVLDGSLNYKARKFIANSSLNYEEKGKMKIDPKVEFWFFKNMDYSCPEFKDVIR